jgi:hypothetical protein
MGNDGGSSQVTCGNFNLEAKPRIRLANSNHTIREKRQGKKKVNKYVDGSIYGRDDRQAAFLNPQP